jgi:hypothetical protein
MPSALIKHISLVVGLLSKKSKNYLLLTLRPLSWVIQALVWYGQKNHFSYFCYLIRVEHEKCSEMCVWIVGFGQKLRKLGLLLLKKVNI